jgi:hypothetical protein
MSKYGILVGFAMAATTLTNFSANAAVIERSAHSFTVAHSFVVNKNVSIVHHEFSHVGRWWTSAYSLSGNGHNMRFQHSCFCETMPDGENETLMTFLDRKRDKSAVLSGAIGPLRDQPVKGKMTWLFDKTQYGTKVTVEYNVWGDILANNKSWADDVDTMMAEQMVSFERAAKNRGANVIAP